MFVWETLGEVDKGLLVGLLIGKRVLFEEMKFVGVVLLDNRAVWEIFDK